MKKQIVLFTFLQVTVACFAQDKSLPVFEGKTIEVNTVSVRNHLKQFTAFNLESAKLSNFVHQSALSGFRLNLGGNKVWDIDLEPSNIATSDYHLKILTSEGTKVLTSHPDFLFEGKVRGSSKDEQVRLTIKEGFIYGSVQTNGKEYFIEPLNRFSAKKEKDQYIVYEGKDVINNESFSCGVQDKELSLKETEQQKNLKEQSPQDIICKKIKFISVVDYSMYQKFGSDIYAIETQLLSILNLAEGAYTTLNLGADGSTDVGTDRLQFEMDEVVVSTCFECNVAPGEENASTVGSKLLSWASKNMDQKEGKIIQHWSTNSLFDITGKGLSGTVTGVSNCGGVVGEILRYGTDDLSFLRVLVAHETGHTLGCQHDDLIKPGVTGFIMYSGANGSRTRFSTLADFGGVNYSSQQTIRNTVLANISCLEECGNNTCEEVKDLKVDYGDFMNDVRVSWAGSGNYLVKYKVSDSNFYDPAQIIQTSLNNISLSKLESCAIYKFEVQRNCGASVSKASSILFKTSSLSVNSQPINIHGDQYDLEINLVCKKCSDKEYYIKFDGKPYNIVNSSSLNQFVFKDLFADGARHRIEISKDSGNIVCAATSFYTAPYYRSSSKNLLNSDFNNCVIPGDWKDSLLAKHNVSSPDAHWIIAQQNFFTPRTMRGTLDSTCMIYYNSFNSQNKYSGAISLTSSKIDLTKYKNIKLHYDYNFLAYKFSNSPAVGSITVEAFGGSNWRKISERQADLPNVSRNIWDSLPQRVFIDLDSFKNKEFQLRFIVDDGSLIQKTALGVFAAFDNIVVDGYLQDSSSANNITVYPNPTRQELFVKFELQPISNIYYRLVDVNGRIVGKGVLNNYRINMNASSSGMYLLELYSDDRMIATKKILKL